MFVFKFFTEWFANFFLEPTTNFTFAPKSEQRSPKLFIPDFFCLYPTTSIQGAIYEINLLILLFVIFLLKEKNFFLIM